MLNRAEVGENGIERDLGCDLSGRRDTILVVEDEGFVLEAACDILESEGYGVLRARNAGEAHAAVGKVGGRVQLLVTDVVLPGQSGPKLGSELQVAHPGLKVIFISGYPANTVRKYGVAAGQRCYLPKPFSAETLLGKVRQVLQGEEAGVSP